MTEALSMATFAIALILYAGASALFYLDVVRATHGTRKEGGSRLSARAPSSAFPSRNTPLPPSLRGPESVVSPVEPRTDLAPTLLGLGAVGHAGYVAMASFVAH